MKKYKSICVFTHGVGLVIEIESALYLCGGMTVTQDTFPHSWTALHSKKKCFHRKRIHFSCMACTPNPLSNFDSKINLIEADIGLMPFGPAKTADGNYFAQPTWFLANKNSHKKS